MIVDQALTRFLAVGLRVSALAAKLLLTLYMARFLSLDSLGLYGLVFAAVMISTSFLGARLDFIQGRELVGAADLPTATKIKDQTFFYLSHYIALGLVLMVVHAFGIGSPLMLVTIWLITIFENLGQAFTANIVAQGRPLLATFILFLRSGFWCIPVILLGLLVPATRHVEFVLLGWVLGAGSGLLTCMWIWRHLPWRGAFANPVDLGWLKRSVKRSFPIWVATMGAMTASSLDRFVVSSFLDLEMVGVLTFYGSFAFALLALVQSGFFAFSYPRLIRFHRAGDEAAFSQETRSVCVQSIMFIVAASILLGIIIPLSAGFLGKEEFVQEAPVLWLLLTAVCIRTFADTFYYVLYARDMDKPLWMGDVLHLIPITGFNLLLVPLFGLEGAGLSAIFGALFLLGWWGIYACRGSDLCFIRKKEA